MNNSALIVGAGGFGMELYSLLEGVDWPVAGFVDTRINPEIEKTGKPYLGSDADLETIRSQVSTAFIAVGDMHKRTALFTLLQRCDYNLPPFVHPLAYVAKTARISAGSVIYPHATLHHNVRIGRGVLINSHATVGHDSVCGDFATLNPNAAVAGRVSIGERVFIGLGAGIIENLSLCAETTIGAGAIVIASIEESGTYVGCPARKVR